ncbi:MAG TPA: hypothetical protein VIY90_17740 [Steroidobacteraceae bacterium]
MRGRGSVWVTAAAGSWMAFAAAAQAPAALPQVLADAPTDLSVTVYRDPGRSSGAMDLDHLSGFALIRETRVVRVPAGESRVRFEGVADGIEPVSAIVSGLPNGLIEKNLDAELLSPASLIAAAQGRPLTLVRGNSRTGKIERLPGVIRSGPEADGVVFQTQDGIEALRCSGLPETFNFAGTTRLSASPTLSAVVRSTRAVTEEIQLSYLAYGFDWFADYTATLSADGKMIDLGAWVTLANGNGVGFPSAHTQVVAGQLNRETNGAPPVADEGAMLAGCWPKGSTSEPVQLLEAAGAIPLGFAAAKRARATMVANAVLEEVAVTGARRVSQEQLGDLKLYRVPERTTVASRQSKQVRLLDRAGIPVRRIFVAVVDEHDDDGRGGADWVAPAEALLRTRNDAANHLGLPLPSGQVVVFAARGGARLLLHQDYVRDLAVNEEVEIALGSSSDVQVRCVSEQTSVDRGRARTIPLLPGVVSLRRTSLNSVRRIEVSNARSAAIDFELVVRLADGARIIRADRPLGTRNGRPVFRLKVPAHHIVTVRFQSQRSQIRAIRPPQ